MPHAPPPSRPRRRWTRVSLRGLMLVTLLFGGGLGWFAHAARVQREAVAAIRATGGAVGYRWWAWVGGRDPARGPAALARLVA